MPSSPEFGCKEGFFGILLNGESTVHFCRRALNFIEPLFDEVCIKDQDILGTDDRIRKFTALIPDDEFRNSVGTAMLSLRSSKERWQKFLQMYQSTSQVMSRASSTRVYKMYDIKS